jgi:hypothetical protein
MDLFSFSNCFFRIKDAPMVRSLASIVAVDLLTLKTKLQCHIDSYPHATIMWTFNSQPIVNSTKYTIVNVGNVSSMLIIEQVQSHVDYGYYTCHAMNQLGNHSALIQVRSKGKNNCPDVTKLNCRRNFTKKKRNESRPRNHIDRHVQTNDH